MFLPRLSTDICPCPCLHWLSFMFTFSSLFWTNTDWWWHMNPDLTLLTAVTLPEIRYESYRIWKNPIYFVHTSMKKTYQWLGCKKKISDLGHFCVARLVWWGFDNHYEYHWVSLCGNLCCSCITGSTERHFLVCVSVGEDQYIPFGLSQLTLLFINLEYF